MYYIQNAEQGKASIIQKTDLRKNHIMLYKTTTALLTVCVYMQKARGVATSLEVNLEQGKPFTF